MRLLSIAATAVLFTGFVGAEDAPAKPVPTSAQAEQEGAPMGSPVQTAGKITSIHCCSLMGGATAAHTMVKIQTDEGDTDIVDLGSTELLKKNGLEPKEGMKLWIDGQVGQINDRFIIVAERISESRLVQVTRAINDSNATQARYDGKETGGKEAGADLKNVKVSNDPGAKVQTVDAGQQVRTVEGKIIGTRKVKIEGVNEEHVIAKIETDSGIAVIDLGSGNMMPKGVTIEDGQSLAATGLIGRLNGKPIILAKTVGNLTAVHRPAMPKTVTPNNAAPTK